MPPASALTPFEYWMHFSLMVMTLPMTAYMVLRWAVNRHNR